MRELMSDSLARDAQRVLAAVDLTPVAGRSVLLTGASGLVGTHLLASLDEAQRRGKGAGRVVAVVHGEVPVHLEPLLAGPATTVIRGDLTDPALLPHAGHFDFIVHAAGYGQPGRFMADPIKTIALNTVCTLRLFDLLAPGGHLLFVSTSEVYSGLAQPPFCETRIGTTNTDHPRACYIEAKRCGEAICNAYRSRGVAASSARLALAYGPGTRRGDQRVLNVFIERALTQRGIRLQDMGGAQRTYCYVSDAVELLWHILLGADAAIYNVGGTSRLTIAELARRIGRHLDVPVEFPAGEQTLSGAPEDVQLDLGLVAREFGKTRFVPIEEGLAQTIKWQAGLYQDAAQMEG